MATTTKKPAKAAAPAKSSRTRAKSATATRSRAILEGTPPAKPAKSAAATKPPASATDAKPTKVPTAAATPSPVTTAPQPVIVGPVLRKKELIQQIVERTGKKKKDVKPVVEATLAELGAALSENRELNLRPMGKLKVTREKHLPNGRVVVAKIRQPKKPKV